MDPISAGELLDVIRGGDAHALLDIRSPVDYDRGHIHRASCVPRAVLETRIAALVPAKAVPIVVCDDEGTHAAGAARDLRAYGYAARHLEGGLAAWRAAGYPTVEGVNVPSKAFGEWVAVDDEVPIATPQEVFDWLRHDPDTAVFEVRPYREVARTGSIPGAINVPGVELPMRIGDHLHGRKRIVVTCAGRTRGIIATQTLRMMGVDGIHNLKGGTMGWALAGFELEKPVGKASPPSARSMAESERFAIDLAAQAGIPVVSPERLRELCAAAGRQAVYVIDVRTSEEFAQGHIPDSVHAPGGQLIQVTDSYVGVRVGTIVLVSAERARATITAYWLRRMGYPNVFVLDGGIGAWSALGMPLRSGRPRTDLEEWQAASAAAVKISPAALARILDNGPDVRVLDVGSARRFAEAHIPGARWMGRGTIDRDIHLAAPDKAAGIVLVCPDGERSTYTAATLRAEGYVDIKVLDGGVGEWIAAGSATESGWHGDGELRDEDEWIPPYVRGPDDMRRYLAWEERLLEMRETLA